MSHGWEEAAQGRMGEAKEVAQSIKDVFKNEKVDTVTAIMAISILDQQHQTSSPQAHKLCQAAAKKCIITTGGQG